MACTSPSTRFLCCSRSSSRLRVLTLALAVSLGRVWVLCETVDTCFELSLLCDTFQSQLSTWRPRSCLRRQIVSSCCRWSSFVFLLPPPWRIELACVKVACRVWEMIKIKNRSKRPKLMIVTSWRRKLLRLPLLIVRCLAVSWYLLHWCCRCLLLLRAENFVECTLKG